MRPHYATGLASRAELASQHGMRPGKALRIVIDSAIAAGLGAAGVGITGKEGFNMTLLQNVVPVVEERFMQLLELFDGLIAPPVAPPVAPPGFFD